MTTTTPGTPRADEADMREVSHFLSELKNGSESRAGDVACEIPHSAPAHEVGAGSDLDPPASSTPLDPLQKGSPETKVGCSQRCCCTGRPGEGRLLVFGDFLGVICRCFYVVRCQPAANPRGIRWNLHRYATVPDRRIPAVATCLLC